MPYDPERCQDHEHRLTVTETRQQDAGSAADDLRRRVGELERELLTRTKASLAQSWALLVLLAGWVWYLVTTYALPHAK